MQLKHIPILGLAALVAAQDAGNDTQSLNATLSANDQLSNLTSLLSSNPELLSALSQASDITILAPSNEALSEFLASDAGRQAGEDPGLLAAVLQYHVLNGTFQASQVTNESAFIPTLLTDETYANVSGGQVVEAVRIGEDVVFYSGLLQNSTVTSADQNFTGGTLHVIDRVLTLPPSIPDAALALNLTSLRGALNVSDSLEAASTPNITVFAPTNEAFRAIGSALANLSNDDLRDILEYHVVEGVYYASDLENGTTLRSEDDEEEISVRINEDGRVFVNGAEVVVRNVLVANGVLHIVDNVLNPSNASPASPSATAGAPGFTASATAATEVPFTSGQPAPTTTVDPSEQGAGPAASTAGGAEETESAGAAVPRATGASAVEYVAVFGVGVALLGL